MIQKIQIPD